VPVVTVQMWQGQSVENKRRMAQGITDLLSPFMNNRPDKITVIFSEVPLESWASGGQLSADRADLQEKVSRGLPPSGAEQDTGVTERGST
jgi:4-oxalocrotonate tautomerase